MVTRAAVEAADAAAHLTRGAVVEAAVAEPVVPHRAVLQRPWAEATDGASRTRAVVVSGIHRRGREWPTRLIKKFDAVITGLFY